MADIADRTVGTTGQVEVGQEWRSKRNGRVVKVTRLHHDEHNDVIGVGISDARKNRVVTSDGRSIPGYEFLQPSDFVSFGDIARSRLGMQCQYARDYLDRYKSAPGGVKMLKIEGYCGEGIRWRGNLDDYHGIEIHKADVETFVKRVTDFRRATHQIA